MSPVKAPYKEGVNFVGTGPRNFGPVPGAPGLARAPINTWTETAGHGAVIALDPRTGDRKWTFAMTDVTDSGILTTASDVLFTGGREGYFQALDARTGALLWKLNLGAAINSGPISYRVGNNSTCPSCPGCRSRSSRSTTSGAQPCQALAAAPRHISTRYPEDEASQQDTEPRRICKTSIPGPNPSGASNLSL